MNTSNSSISNTFVRSLARAFARNRRAAVNAGTGASACIPEAIRPVIEMLEHRQLLAAVTGSAFNYLTAPQNLTFDFNANVSSDLSLDDLVVDRLSNNSTLARANQSLSYNTGNNKATVTFPSEANQGITGMMPDGNFQAIISEAGIPGMTAEHLLNYFFLIADANHDRAVSLDDFSMFQFGIYGDFSQGDFNLSGYVDLDDYTILQANFGRQMPAPVTTENTLSVAALSSSANRLTWTRPGDEVAVDGYRVFVSTDGANFTQIAQLAANVRTYDHTGLTDGTKYWYRVRPFTNAEGNSETTNKVSAVTVLPGPATVSTHSITDDDGTGVVLNWPVASAVATSYLIQRAMSSDFSSGVVEFEFVPNDSESSYRDRSVNLGQTYHYRVRAKDDVATSAYSLSTSAVTPIPPADVPSDVTVRPLSNTQIDVAWSDVEFNDAFRLERSTDPDFTTGVSSFSLSGSQVSYTDTVPAGDLYYYRLRAEAVSGNSDWSPIIIGDSSNVTPKATTDLDIISLSDESFGLSWPDTSNETEYEVQRSDSASFGTNVVTTSLPAGTTSYVDPQVPDSSITWYYRLRSKVGQSIATSDAVSSDTGLLRSTVSSPLSYIKILKHTTGNFGSIVGDTSVPSERFFSGVPIHVRITDVALKAIGDEFGTKYKYTWFFGSNAVSYKIQTGVNAAAIYEVPNTASAAQQRNIRLRIEKIAGTDSESTLVFDRVFDIYVEPTRTDPPTNSDLTKFKVIRVAPATSDWGISADEPDSNAVQRVGLSWLLSNRAKWNQSNTIIRFQRGTNKVYNINAQQPIGSDSTNSVVSNLILESDPDTSGAQPIIRATFANASQYIISVGNTARNIVVRDLTITSSSREQTPTWYQSDLDAYNNGTKSLAEMEATNRVPDANFEFRAGRASSNAPKGVELDGANVAVIGCSVGYLTQFAQNEQNADARGMLIQNNISLNVINKPTLGNNPNSQDDDNLSSADDYPILQRYHTIVLDSENLVMIGNEWRYSYDESVVRIQSGNIYGNFYTNVFNKLRESRYTKDGQGIISSLSRLTATDKSPLRLSAGRETTPGSGVFRPVLFHAFRNELNGGESWLGPLGAVRNDPTDVNEKTRGLVFDSNIVRSSVKLNFGFEQSVLRNNIFTGTTPLRVEGDLPSQWVDDDINNSSNLLIYREIRPASQLIRDVDVVHNTFTGNLTSTRAAFRFTNPKARVAPTTGTFTTFQQVEDASSGPSNPSRPNDYFVRIKNFRWSNNLVARPDGSTRATPNIVLLDELDAARDGHSARPTWSQTMVGSGGGALAADKWTISDNLYDLASTASTTSFQIGGTYSTSGVPSNPAFNRLSLAQWNTFLDIASTAPDEEENVTVGVESSPQNRYVTGDEFKPTAGGTGINIAARQSSAWFDYIAFDTVVAAGSANPVKTPVRPATGSTPGAIQR